MKEGRELSPSNHQLDPDTEAMIAQGVAARRQGGMGYVEAAQDERASDIHGTPFGITGYEVEDVVADDDDNES